MKCILLSAALIAAPYLALAASFNCSNAHTTVEELICSNNEISDLDSKLGSAYKYVLRFTYAMAKDSMITDQKNWITNIRDKCGTASCLINSYNSRINVLTHIIKSGKLVARYVTDQKERLDKTAEFQNALKFVGLNGKITDCDLMVEVIDDMNGRDQSFGAVCRLNNRDVMLCDDTMIGKLTVKLGGFAIASDELAGFTESNCPRGG